MNLFLPFSGSRTSRALFRSEKFHSRVSLVWLIHTVWAETHVFRKRLSEHAALAACLSVTRTRRLRSRNQGVVRLLFNPPIEISENMIRKGEEKEGIGEGSAREAFNRERRVRLFCGAPHFAKLRRRDNPSSNEAKRGDASGCTCIGWKSDSYSISRPRRAGVLPTLLVGVSEADLFAPLCSLCVTSLRSPITHARINFTSCNAN